MSASGVTVADFSSLLAPLGATAMQLIALSVVILLGLFSIRQQQITIQPRTYLFVVVFLLFSALTVVDWLAFPLILLSGRLQDAQVRELGQTLVVVGCATTLIYLLLLTAAVRDLVAYLRRFEVA